MRTLKSIYSAFIALLLATIMADQACAATAGGFPSRPKFQALTVNAIAIEGGLYVSKPSDTARTSLTTVAIDPNLQLTLPTNGATYRVVIRLYWNLSTTVAQGYSWSITTFALGAPLIALEGSSVFPVCTVFRSDTGGPVSLFNAAGAGGLYGINTAVITGISDTVNITVAGSDYQETCDMTIVPTSANAQIGVAWAQAVSSANATTLRRGSFISAQRIK